MKNRFGQFVGVFVIAYFISVIVAFNVYDWNSFRQHSLARWHFVDGFVNFGRSMVWPYFVFRDSGPSGSEHDSKTHFKKSNDLNLEALSLLNEVGHGIPPPEINAKVIALFEESIAEAGMVDTNMLSLVASNYPAVLQAGYIRSMEIMIDGFQETNMVKVAGGMFIREEYKKWWNQHLDDINSIMSF